MVVYVAVSPLWKRATSWCKLLPLLMANTEVIWWCWRFLKVLLASTTNANVATQKTITRRESHQLGLAELQEIRGGGTEGIEHPSDT